MEKKVERRLVMFYTALHKQLENEARRRRKRRSFVTLLFAAAFAADVIFTFWAYKANSTLAFLLEALASLGLAVGGCIDERPAVAAAGQVSGAVTIALIFRYLGLHD